MAKNFQVSLPPHDPARTCFKCQSDNVDSGEWHDSPRRVIGAEKRTDCEQFFPDRIGEHLCRTCRDCGFTWCESVSTSGPGY